MTPILKADLLLLVHLSFMLFVVLAQLLVLVGWPLGWRWVRNPYFRGVHLACILYVTVQAILGIECPLTTWERDLRGGYLYEYDGSLPIVPFASGLLYYDASIGLFAWIYGGFATLVLLTWVFAPPRLRTKADYSSISR